MRLAQEKLLTSIQRLDELMQQLKKHPGARDFAYVATAFHVFSEGFQQQNPVIICALEAILNKSDWSERKDKALKVAKSIDPSLTMDIFPEDVCRSFIPVCRILMEAGSDEEKIQRITAMAASSLQEHAPQWVRERFASRVQTAATIVKKTEAADHLLAKVLKNVCACCSVSKEKLLLCSGCRNIRYCSADCQKADWVEHKKLCGK